MFATVNATPTSKGLACFRRGAGVLATWGDLESLGKPPTTIQQTVFVVHGRDEAARTAMFDFLGSIGLRPMEWAQAVALTNEGTPYPGTVLDRALEAAQAIVVLLTPDEIVRLRPDLATTAEDGQVGTQARPNVLYEAGMAMAKDPARTILVEIGPHRKFSDIDGRYLLRMDNSGEKRNGLIQRLRSAGCAPDTSGNYWMRAGDFTPPVIVDEVLPGEVAATPDAVEQSSDANQDGIAVAIQAIKGNGSGSFVARGRVTNNNKGTKTVSVSATYFSESGEILGTATGMVNSVNPGQTKTIELISFDNLDIYHSQTVQIDHVV